MTTRFMDFFLLGALVFILPVMLALFLCFAPFALLGYGVYKATPLRWRKWFLID